MFSFRKFFQSLRCAFSGLRYAFKEEQSFRAQVTIALIVIGLMFYFNVAFLEKIILLIAAFTVLSFELINTTSEKILDVIEPDLRPGVGIIKDTMAAAVILACLGALVIGLMIFLPYLLE